MSNGRWRANDAVFRAGINVIMAVGQAQFDRSAQEAPRRLAPNGGNAGLRDDAPIALPRHNDHGHGDVTFGRGVFIPRAQSQACGRGARRGQDVRSCGHYVPPSDRERMFYPHDGRRLRVLPFFMRKGVMPGIRRNDYDAVAPDG